ncbi:MAG TPA: ABC transporter ATP-binding protein [Gaiellaceae bacterium]
MTEPILVVEDVAKRFGGVAAVDGASFTVAPHSITALIGPNGAGKSTLFNVVSGFERADRGDVTFAGRSIFGVPAYRIARRGLVRTFQLTKTLTVMSVLDNMLLAAGGNPGEGLAGAVLRLPAWIRYERRSRARALELLETFGLAAKANDYAGQLSGGQRKLLELARALMLEPEMVLLDEPLAGVNPSLGRRLLEHIEELRRERGTTFLFVEHDMDVVMRHSDRVVVMAQGRVIVEGTPDEIRTNEQVIEAYLGTEAAADPELGTPLADVTDA